MKKIKLIHLSGFLFILIAVFFGFYYNLSDILTPGFWTTGANIPTQVYSGGSVGYTKPANDTGWQFITGGFEPSSAGNITMAYNFVTNTWATLAPLPYLVNANGMAQLKDSVYTFGGNLSGSSTTANFYKYDIHANTWTAKVPMPLPGSFCAGVGYQDSLIYVQIGYTGTDVPGSIYLWNCNTNIWRSASSLPGGRFGGAFARSGDTLVYIGGADISLLYNQTFLGVISQTNHSQIMWSSKSVCPAFTGGMYRIGACSWKPGQIIVTGGSYTSGWSTSNACYVYILSTDTWVQQPGKPTGWTAGQSGVVYLKNGSVTLCKLGCASGWNGTSTIPYIEIYTDTTQLVEITSNNKEFPGTYSLSQNYPNPFNPVTIINYSLLKAGNVDLKVYDILGREIAVLINEFKKAGYYDVKFDGANLSSGIYFYKIESGNYISVKKMVLEK